MDATQAPERLCGYPLDEFCGGTFEAEDVLTAGDDGLVVNSSENGCGKDTWVLA